MTDTNNNTIGINMPVNTGLLWDTDAMPINTYNTTTRSPYTDLVDGFHDVSVGAGVDLPEGSFNVDWGDGSGDPYFSTYNIGTGPVMLTDSAAAVDLTNITAPTYFAGLSRSTGFVPHLQIINGDVPDGGDVANSTFQLDVWSVVIDQNESNDLLIASPDGTQDQQPVTMYFPRPVGEALTVKLTSTDSSQNDLFTFTGTPLTPSGVDSDSNSYYTFDIGADDPSYLTLEDGATEGNNTKDVLKYKEHGTYQASLSTTDCQAAVAAGNQTVPGNDPVSKPASQEGVKIALVGNPNGDDTIHQDNIAGATIDWLVGQYADLIANVTGPTLPPMFPPEDSFKWSIPGKVLKDYTETSASATKTDLDNNNGRESKEVKFFWVATGNNPESDEIELTVRHSNSFMSNLTFLHASTTFVVSEPDGTLTPGPTDTSTARFGAPRGKTGLWVGLWAPNLAPGLTATGNVTGANGSFKFLQVGTSVMSRTGSIYQTDGTSAPVLAQNGPLNGVLGLDVDGTNHPNGSAATFADSPAEQLIQSLKPVVNGYVVSTLSQNVDFELYLMYQPPSSSIESAWVPLRVMSWHWIVNAIFNFQVRPPYDVASQPPNPVVGPTSEEPLWKHNLKDQQFPKT